MITLDYEIVASGSKGNCVVINDVMVDCGATLKQMKEHLYDVKYLLITHIHSDHVKSSTLLNIKIMHPQIIVIGNYEVHQKFGVNIIANAGFEIETEDYTFTPFECEHDVLTYGFTWKYKDNDIIYATDTASLDNAPVQKYDYLFLESNHDEKKIEQVRDKVSQYGYNPYLSAKRHLSTQQARTFYFLNRRNKDSKFIELHKSSRFY